MENQPRAPQTLRKDALGLLSIVFLVIATNGPLTALVGAVPVSIAMGNGIGVPGSFVVAGGIYLLFSIGYAAMSRYVKNAGAFYAYIAAGLGRPAGVGGAFLALLAYNAIQLACYALVGFFLSQALVDKAGISVSWWISATCIALIVHYFGYRNVEFSGRFLCILMLCEIAIILLFDAAVVVHGGGPKGFPLASFSPSTVFTSGFGPSLVFVVGSYMGFETTAIYSEEAKDPGKTIPRATYAAITIIMVLYAVSVWMIISAYGPDAAVAQANKDPGNMWFSMTAKLVGTWASDAMGVLMITSLLAALISFHNTISRYFYSLAREGIIWSRLAKTHSVQQTPFVASIVQTVCGLIVIVVCGLLKIDPLQGVLPWSSVVASVGIVAVQAFASLAVVGFFWRSHRGVSVWQRTVSPALASLGLFLCLWQIIIHVDLLSGSKSIWSELVPWATLATGLGGACFAVWLKTARPSLYNNLGRLLNEV
ncbi:APC family permease [Paraburkholderia sp. CNPSo 3272]|uniref:APC family permease n=1 Tax=Paraburkholderia sp. CNPSo 3272 TaxID=2940931 RepID=UPI0020B70126|nr:APC family permease [Paraburkholderia sp. CNPSo 3272]MCP3727112.1 APC family permease [Paraburkholderia sp. CNPSo 3272]